MSNSNTEHCAVFACTPAVARGLLYIHIYISRGTPICEFSKAWPQKRNGQLAIGRRLDPLKSQQTTAEHYCGQLNGSFFFTARIKRT